MMGCWQVSLVPKLCDCCFTHSVSGFISLSHPLFVFISSYFSVQDFRELWMKLLFLDIYTHIHIFLSRRK